MSKGGTLASTKVVNAEYSDRGTPQQTTDYSLFSLSSVQHAISDEVKLDGNPIQIIVDTSAGVSIISERTFRNAWKHQTPVLRPAGDVTLKSYTGQSIVMGKIEPDITYNGQTTVKPILVVHGDRPNLSGRNILEVIRMDLANMFSVCNSVTSSQLVDEFPHVFSEEFGTLRGKTVKLYVDKNAVPRFHRPRPVPCVIKDKIEDELQRLQQDDIIEPVTFSKWAAPIVPVRKGTGVRSCSDYKVTVNRDH